MRTVISWIITALAVGVAVWIVPGIDVWGPDMYLSIGILALLLALINTFVKPIIKLLSMPITILTLGLFLLVINTGLLYLAAWIGNELFNVAFHIEGFWSAFFGALIISVVTMLLNALTGVKDPPKNTQYHS